jgi:simple sugar transport system substrate-binding protein
MTQNLTRRAVLGSGLALAGLAAGTRAIAQAAPLKVGFVYVSPVGDAGWSYQHDLGRREMETALAGRVQSTVVESVPEGPDAERVLRDLARQGHGLVFATSFGYLEPALRAATDYPDTRFEHAGGFKLAPNLGTYDARWYEGRYLAGLIAGATTHTGVAGYVAGFPVPEVVQGIDAFTLGMRAANPKATVRLVWLHSWFDPARESEAATTLVSQGADILVNHSASPAVAQAAERQAARGVRFIGYQSDMRAYAPDVQLASVTQHFGGFYTATARRVLDGTWASQAFVGGLADGMVALSALSPRLAPELRALLETKRKAIIDGSFKVFSGPLADNHGRVRLAGGALDDGAIRKLDWLVAGVVGSMP